MAEHTRINFGEAIQHLKSGGKAARFGWNGKEMYIFLKKGVFDGSSLGFENGANPQFNHPSTLDGVSLGLFLSEKSTTTILPCFCMYSATGAVVVGWLASQTDMLAEDWTKVESK